MSISVFGTPRRTNCKAVNIRPYCWCADLRHFPAVFLEEEIDGYEWQDSRHIVRALEHRLFFCRFPRNSRELLALVPKSWSCSDAAGCTIGRAACRRLVSAAPNQGVICPPLCA